MSTKKISINKINCITFLCSELSFLLHGEEQCVFCLAGIAFAEAKKKLIQRAIIIVPDNE